MTGWDTGLSQDYCRELGRWFADRLGAREQLRRDGMTREQEAVAKSVIELLHKFDMSGADADAIWSGQEVALRAQPDHSELLRRCLNDEFGVTSKALRKDIEDALEGKHVPD